MATWCSPGALQVMHLLCREDGCLALGTVVDPQEGSKSFLPFVYSSLAGWAGWLALLGKNMLGQAIGKNGMGYGGFPCM